MVNISTAQLLMILRRYQPRTNIVKGEKSNLFTDCNSILGRWRFYFSQLFNVHGVSDVRQAEIHTAEPIVPELSAFEVQMAIEKLKRHKSPGIDQIPAELIKAEDRTFFSEITKFIKSSRNVEEFPVQWKESIIVPL